MVLIVTVFIGKPKATDDVRFTAEGLAHITVDKVAEAMQVSSSNPMVGLEGRTSLLVGLSTALKSNPQFFGQDARPGNMLGIVTCVIAFIATCYS
jgi:hypothetical protein